jgi:hypothetical protein
MSAQATTDDAVRAIAKLVEMSLDLRACAILDAEGEQLAASSEADWAAGATELWSAAGDDSSASPTQVHVATIDGEVFAARDADGRSAVAVTDRFALASLMFCDLRAALRELDPLQPAPAAAGNG